MQVTLNGVVMTGTPEQIGEVARRLGVQLGEDGIFYTSKSRGLILIADMDENHLRNAVKRRYIDHYSRLAGLDGADFTKHLSGPQDKTTVAMVARLVQFNYEKSYRNTRSTRY